MAIAQFGVSRFVLCCTLATYLFVMSRRSVGALYMYVLNSEQTCVLLFLCRIWYCQGLRPTYCLFCAEWGESDVGSFCLARTEIWVSTSGTWFGGQMNANDCWTFIFYSLMTFRCFWQKLIYPTIIQEHKTWLELICWYEAMSIILYIVTDLNLSLNFFQLCILLKANIKAFIILSHALLNR